MRFFTARFGGDRTPLCAGAEVEEPKRDFLSRSGVAPRTCE